MIHTFIGNLGHFLLIASFVFSLLASVLYFIAAREKDPLKSKQWAANGRASFYIHGAAVIGAIVSLFLIIYNHYFEYHYAWSHSSRTLPVHYMISSFWEGQEGSFLLWIFWHVGLGILLINTAKKWESPVMAIFSLVQAFLASMILGVVVFNVKVGSSPFILLRDAMDAPIFQTNPDFVPEDGNGLNPLLQNIWMVIHPPFLFLGFAATLAPFAFLMAGLWQRKYKEWVRPALPWSIGAAGTLGLGILMGAYWAYETLNFGGYWNWDPVENAVYVPWLTLVGAIHGMNIYLKKRSGLRTSAILIIASFVLILYSTFLTRSGILGASSNHAFTDLGLHGQLLLYLLAFLIIAVALLIIRWKEIPASKTEMETYSGEFWVFIGIVVMALMAFQVLYVTSYPVINSFLELFGVSSNLAPPADQAGYYSKFQLWFALGVALVSGAGQFFWWKKISRNNLWDEMGLPIIVTLALSIVVILAADVSHISYILLLTAAIYALIANGILLLRFIQSKKGLRLSGGAVAHIGIALMLIGIIFSSGYSTVISQNTSGRKYSNDFSEEMNQNNVLLWLGEPLKMNRYELTYKGPRLEPVGMPGYIDKNKVVLLSNRLAIAIDTFRVKNRFFHPGDSIEVYGENTYYEVRFAQENGRTFTLYPRAQVNPNMGLIASPDIKKHMGKDLYTHVSSIPDPEVEKEWSEVEEHKLKTGDRFLVNDYVAELINVARKNDLTRIALSEGDVAVSAKIRILTKGGEYLAEPVYFIKNYSPGMIPDYIPEIGARFSFMHIDPASNEFTIGVQTTQRDYIILKAMEKPHINILWTGTVLLTVGFGIAAYRRFKDGRRSTDK